MSVNREKFSVGFLFDDTLDSNDGVAQQVKRLGEWFAQNGHRVVYLCGETKIESWAGGKIYSLSKNIAVKFNGNRLSMPLISHSKQIKQVLTAEKLDILHVQVPYSPLMAQRVIRRAYKKSAIVGTFHILPSGWLSSFGSRLLKLAQWASLRKFDSMISVSSSAAVFAKKNFGIDSVIIPNMINLASFKQNNVGSIKNDRIVFLGRLVKRKGCAELIKAFAILSKTKPTAELVIAGDGKQRKNLEKLVKRLGLNDKVRFLGFISENEKPKLLGGAAIACFPSLYGESFGIVLLEAMASGSGVVLAGDNPGYNSVMQAQPKLLVNVRNTEAFAQRLNELLTDKVLTTKLHNWQINYVQQFDINVVGQKILKLYLDAIAKRHSKRHN